MASASQIVAERLAGAGCRHAFGVPGGEVLVVVEALARAGVRMVLTRHENCAGFMGEGVHHHDRAPAILVATIGPGLANAVNVIANAWQDRVPLIVLTGCVSVRDRHTYTHQVFDHLRLIEPVCKAAFRVEDGTAEVLVEKALAIATEGRPGPVLLDLPVDVQGREQPDVRHVARTPLAPAGPAPGAALEQARAWLAQSRRPLMIAGLDVLNQGAEVALAAFCRAERVPLITTYKAKGVLPEDDPLALGGAGLSPRADRVLLPLLRSSDCLLLAGYDPIEMRSGWQDPWPRDARVVEFSAEANRHFMHQASIGFVGDIAAGLDAIAAAPDGATRRWADGALEAAKTALAERFGDNEAWGPLAVVHECRRRLPRDAVATVDSGAHRILLSQAWTCYQPRGLLQSTGLCTMGSAVPLAAGRKLAEPGRAVVAFVGDGGLEMFLGELATLRDLRLGVPIVVFVDHSLALIELKQRALGLSRAAVDFGATDYPALARALGGEGQWCADRETLGAALEQALTRDTFSLLAAPVGDAAYDGRF